MLKRVLEPEAMDTPDEAHDYDAMDHSTVNRVFVADFLSVWDGGTPLLDVGTGTAQIPIELCRQSLLPQTRRLRVRLHPSRLQTAAATAAST